jgi:hypothetical protein
MTPDSYKIVPVTATDEMLKHGHGSSYVINNGYAEYLIDSEVVEDIYRSMLSASPATPELMICEVKDVWKLRDALSRAQKALEGTYDVNCYPADGESDADKAIDVAREALSEFDAKYGGGE